MLELVTASAHSGAQLKTRWGENMADDVVESVKPNTDETLEGLSSDCDNSHLSSGENEEAVKTFKDLVGLSNRAKNRRHFSNINKQRHSSLS